MAVVSRSQWIQLYKDLQRAGLQFPQYNYRHFVRRRIRDYFESNRCITDQVQLDNLYKEGQASLTTIQRQATIANLYPQRKLVIEAPSTISTD
ncbi:complex 1 protein (LYR family) domain-containing protein [Ditylenchus destructor]|uniref:Complex 1 protein (LYR family) domain-containing protein n=1 Tax=Ditylenchus destructor TaxID=166010 RepID=A0AAD4NKM7_9BILA|nr:complex 1 protein (LYR family) domain-containing protein [Ditylenchus destructor]